jgi:hypothetical protein
MIDPREALSRSGVHDYYSGSQWDYKGRSFGVGSMI